MTILASRGVKAVPTVAVESIVKTIHALKGVRRMRIVHQIKNVIQVLAKMLAMLKLQIRVRIPNTQHVKHGVPRLHIHAHVITLLARPDINVIPVTHQAHKIQQIPDYASL